MDQSYSYDFSKSTEGRYRNAMTDIAAGARMWRIWTLLGWRDFRSQTNRTILGMLWPILGLAITVGALGYVYGALLTWPSNTGYPYIAAGFVSWFFISGCVQGGLTIFVNSAGLIKERPLPISFSVYRYTWRMFIEFCMKFSVFAIMAFLVQLNPGMNVFYVLPGMFLYFLTGLWINLLFGLLGARVRDLSQMVTPLMLIAFLSTPVMWPKTALGKRAFITDLNPFSHFIDIIREPLLGYPPPTAALIVVGTFLVIGSILSFVVFAHQKSRLVFWL